MMSSIFFVGFDYELNKKMLIEVAKKLELYFLDLNDLIAYNISKKEALSKVSLDYYNKEVKKIVLSTTQYEDTLVNMPFDIFVSNKYCQTLAKNNLVIYIRLEKSILEQNFENKTELKKQETALLAFEELDKILKNNSKIVIDFNNEREFIKKLTKKLKDLPKSQ